MPGPLDGLLARGDVQLPVDSPGVGVYRVKGEIEGLPDLPLGEFGGEKPQHVELPLAECLR